MCVQTLPIAHGDREAISERFSVQMYRPQVKEKNSRYRITAKSKSNIYMEAQALFNGLKNSSPKKSIAPCNRD